MSEHTQQLRLLAETGRKRQFVLASEPIELIEMAADRIELLEAQVAALETDLESVRDIAYATTSAYNKRDQEINDLRAEVERLRKQLTHRTGAHKDPVAGCPGCEEDGDEGYVDTSSIFALLAILILAYLASVVHAWQTTPWSVWAWAISAPLLFPLLAALGGVWAWMQERSYMRQERKQEEGRR